MSVDFRSLEDIGRDIAAASSTLETHLLACAVRCFDGIEEAFRCAKLQVHFILEERGIRLARRWRWNLLQICR